MTLTVKFMIPFLTIGPLNNQSLHISSSASSRRKNPSMPSPGSLWEWSRRRTRHSNWSGRSRLSCRGTCATFTMSMTRYVRKLVRSGSPAKTAGWRGRSTDFWSDTTSFTHASSNFTSYPKSITQILSTRDLKVSLRAHIYIHHPFGPNNLNYFILALAT